MLAEKPDDKSVMTYVSQYFHRLLAILSAFRRPRYGARDETKWYVDGQRLLTVGACGRAWGPASIAPPPSPGRLQEGLMSAYVRDALALLQWVTERVAWLQQRALLSRARRGRCLAVGPVPG